MLDKDAIISLANEAGIKGPAPARQGFKMYASPQRLMKFAGLVTSKREWVGLTDEEIWSKQGISGFTLEKRTTMAYSYPMLRI